MSGSADYSHFESEKVPILTSQSQFHDDHSGSRTHTGSQSSHITAPIQPYRSIDSSSNDEEQTWLLKLVSRIRRATNLTNDNMYLSMSIFFLMIGTATERVTYKMTVDRMLHYKFVLFELIFLISSALFGSITLYKLYFTNEIDDSMRMFPQSKIFIIAIMDTIQFIIMAVTAAQVSPTMTVIMMHMSTPVVVFVGSRVFPGRRYSAVHYTGVNLILAALTVGLFRAFLADMLDAKQTLHRTVNIVLYAASAALQGLVTLYKEKTIIDWSYPINIYYISSWLFLYQGFITFLFSVGFFLVWGLIYPDLSGNGGVFGKLSEGWSCSLGLSSEMECSERSVADVSVWLILLFVVSNIMILACMNNVLKTNYRTVGRATAAAILGAFFVLWGYDVMANEGHLFLRSNVGYLDVASIVILLVGLEIYGRETEPDTELITNYSPGTFSMESNAQIR